MWFIFYLVGFASLIFRLTAKNQNSIGIHGSSLKFFRTSPPPLLFILSLKNRHKNCTSTIATAIDHHVPGLAAAIEASCSAMVVYNDSLVANAMVLDMMGASVTLALYP